ncbi:Hypothetical predicted protein [Mytilus galloprovincialis]|nr:Hypothetical predicted protein [Mytilus galloprovincialis]
MSGHSATKLLTIGCMIFVWAVMIVVNALATVKLGRDIGLFKNTTGDISDKYYTQITPSGWTFSIWGVIYTWQGIFMVYVLTTICRKVRNHYLYQMSVLPVAVYGIYIVNNLANIAWIIIWDRQYTIAGLCVILITPFTLYVCLFLSFRQLYRNLAYLSKNDATKEIWFIRFFIQNSLAFYAAWVTVASLINLVVVLVYDADVEQELACTITLGILSFEIVAWFIIDNFIIDKYVRYTFSPYIVFFVALIGSFTKNYDLDARYRISIFLLVLMCTAGVLLIVKIITIIIRYIKYPIRSNLEYEATF